MAVEDDEAWKKWDAALANLGTANDALLAHRHLADTHTDKKEAWAQVKLAQSELDTAANEIDPKFKP